MPPEATGVGFGVGLVALIGIIFRWLFTPPTERLWEALERQRTEWQEKAHSLEVALGERDDRIDLLEQDKRQLQTTVNLLSSTVEELLVYAPEEVRVRFRLAEAHINAGG